MKLSKKILLTLGGLLLLSGLVACGNNSDEAAEKSAASGEAFAPRRGADAQPRADGQAQSPTEVKPVSAKKDIPPPPEILTITARVQEVIEGGGFMFMKIDWDGREIWATVPGCDVKVGQELTLLDATVLSNFKSAALNRTFKEIIFASSIKGMQPRIRRGKRNVPPGVMNRRSMRLMASARTPSPGEQTKAAVPAFTAPVYQLEELYNEAADLSGKPVQVRGKVIKTTPQVLGRNWLHITNGKKDSDGQDFDLTITTADNLPEKGAEVVVEGVLQTNRDFGAGYRYQVIVEEARIRPE